MIRKIVKVEWHDRLYHDDWLTSFEAESNTTQITTSVGILMKEDVNSLNLSANVSTDSDEWQGFRGNVVIPRGCVIDITELSQLSMKY